MYVAWEFFPMLNIPATLPAVRWRHHSTPQCAAEFWLIPDLHKACVGPQRHICHSVFSTRRLDRRLLIHLCSVHGVCRQVDLH